VENKNYYDEFITNELLYKIDYIKKNAISVATSNTATLKTYRIIEDVMKKHFTMDEQFAVHNIYLIYVIVAKLVNKDTILYTSLLIDLKSDVYMLPYGVVLDEGFLETLDIIESMIEIGTTLNAHVLEALIK